VRANQCFGGSRSGDRIALVAVNQDQRVGHNKGSQIIAYSRDKLRDLLGKSAFVMHWYSHVVTPHNTPILLPRQLPRRQHAETDRSRCTQTKAHRQASRGARWERVVSRHSTSGAKSWAFRYRVEGKSRKLTLGTLQALSVAEARQKAAEAAVKVHRGLDPVAEKRRSQTRATNTVNAVLDAFVADHVCGLRSGDQVVRGFDVYVRPRIGGKSIYDLKRSDMTAMLNEIKDQHGPVMADRVLAYIRKAFNWQAIQDDAFSSPIVRGMTKTNPVERSRKRVLLDDEIRDLWRALDRLDGCYPRYVKSLLLAMTRRSESAGMHADEIDGDLWTIPAARYKNKRDHVVPITAALRELIGNPEGLVFTNGERPFSGFVRHKRMVDKEIAKIRKAEGRPPMKQWQLHDLRRTARSLMSRAKVDSDHAERCMGHVIGGVRETYDRYEYLEEKRAAFEKLAGLLAVILNPQANVVALRG
jgi:integrase